MLNNVSVGVNDLRLVSFDGECEFYMKSINWG